jgi:hypothetical protein
VFSEEEAIMRAQQLELIYSQSGMLYDIFPDAPWSTLDKAKKNSGPHADDIVGSTQSKSIDLVVESIATIVDTTDYGQPDSEFGCSPYPDVGCTQCVVNESQGQPTDRGKEETTK